MSIVIGGCNSNNSQKSERHLPMEGGFNFRDMGGIRTKDGKSIKWGKIVRSDDLHNLTGADLEYLSAIPIISIVDFRSEDEMKSAPDKLPASTKNYYPYSINPGNLNAAADGLDNLATMNMDSVMMQINVMLVSDSASIKRYRDFFNLLQDEKNVPLLFHCSAGKDRTGMAAALILYALGVDEVQIMEDYLLSNKYIGAKYAKYVEQYPELKSLFEVKREYVSAGINKIKADYGSVEKYLVDVLEVDIEKFRDTYLY